MPFSAIFLQASDHRQHAAQRRPAGTGFPQRGARGDQPVFLRACLPPEPEPRPEQPRVRQPRHAGGVTIGCLQWSARVVSHGHDPPWQTPCSPLLATGRAPAQQLVVAAKVEYNDPKSTDFFVCLFVCLFPPFPFYVFPPPLCPWQGDRAWRMEWYHKTPCCTGNQARLLPNFIHHMWYVLLAAVDCRSWRLRSAPARTARCATARAARRVLVGSLVGVLVGVLAEVIPGAQRLQLQWLWRSRAPRIGIIIAT